MGDCTSLASSRPCMSESPAIAQMNQKITGPNNQIMRLQWKYNTIPELQHYCKARILYKYSLLHSYKYHLHDEKHKPSYSMLIFSFNLVINCGFSSMTSIAVIAALARYGGNEAEKTQPELLRRYQKYKIAHECEGARISPTIKFNLI